MAFEYRTKMIHNAKPVEITLNDGTVVKSVQCIEDPKGEKVLTEVINIKSGRPAPGLPG